MKKILLMVLIISCIKIINITNFKNKDINEDLAIAIINDEKDKAIELISQGANVNDKNNEGLTTLMLACHNGNTEMSKLLIEKGANVNDEDNNEETALIIAVIRENKELVKLLLEKGANVNIKEKNGFTALIIASGFGYLDIVEILLKKGADFNDKNNNGWTALIIASQYGRTEIAKLLIEKGAKIDERFGSTWINKGKSALTIASEKNNKDIIELLVSKGADISGIKNIKLEDILIKNIKTKEINNCLLMMSKYKDKINYKYKDKEDNSLLHYVAMIGSISLFEEFIKKGCNINLRNKNGNTPLDLAFYQEEIQEEFIIYLINKGADINLNLNINGKTLKESLLRYNNLYNKLFLDPLINKFLKGLNLSKEGKEKLKEIIEVLKLKEEDFKSQDKKLMIDLIKENFKFNENRILNVCEINTLTVLENSKDVDLNTDVFISILSNFTIEDFEEHLRSEGINNIKNRFIDRLKDIKAAIPISHLNKPIKPAINASNQEKETYENNIKMYNLACIKFSTKKELYKLGLLISLASEKDKQNIKWAINIILEQLVCHVGTLEAVKYAVRCLMEQDNNNDLKDALSNEVMEYRISLIEEIARKHLHRKINVMSELGRGIADYTNHMLAYLVMDLSDELKVTGLHENEFRYEYDKNFVVNEVKKLYKDKFINEIVELIKNNIRLSNLIRDYLEKKVFKTSNYLTIEDFIHDEDYKIKDNVIKILLVHFGYLR